MLETPRAFINMPGGTEWLWIFLIVLVLFGATALPKLFRSLGKSVREFKAAAEGKQTDSEKDKRQDRADRELGPTRDDSGGEAATEHSGSRAPNRGMD
jgi:sec-independent protein translocase protein TatA